MQNRILKFRVWSKLLKRFCLNTEDGYFGQDEDFANGIFRIESWDRKDIMQQSTGLTDKNGREIFEGDILKFNDYITRIIWSEEDAAFISKSKTGGAFLNPNYMLNFEIIGNVYENPELLNENI